MKDTALVVLGGGQAGAQAIESARAHGFDGSITLVAEESMLPYIRPPLSKQFLTGRFADSWLLYRLPRFYEQHEVDVWRNETAVRIDRNLRVVETTSTKLTYDRLIITTGARVRRLAVPGDDLDAVCYLRTAEDAHRVMQKLSHSKRVVIVGGGFIGLEVAAVLAQSGTFSIDLLVAGDRLGPKLCNDSPEYGDLFSRFLHRAFEKRGVRIHYLTSVSAVTATSDDTVCIKTTSGKEFDANLVVVGIGAQPNIELAQDAGLHCDNGIVVDELARTSDPLILAAGDCTAHPNAARPERIRLETVHNAVEQARTAGATIAGKSMAYRQTPWVWSDQFDYRIQSVGFSADADLTVMRGTVDSERFGLLHFATGRFIGGDFINCPADFGACRRILDTQCCLTPDCAADVAFDLNSIAPRQVKLTFDQPWPSRHARHSAV